MSEINMKRQEYRQLKLKLLQSIIDAANYFNSKETYNEAKVIECFDDLEALLQLKVYILDDSAS